MVAVPADPTGWLPSVMVAALNVSVKVTVPVGVAEPAVNLTVAVTAPARLAISGF